MAHLDDTFVTPVFNGSASLRDGAGQLIESTVKSVRRGETVDDAYISKLYSDVTSLYRLKRGSTTTGEKEELGPLPVTAKLLLGSLITVWVILLLIFSLQKIKKYRGNHKKD